MAHNEFCLRTGETLTTSQWLRSKNGLFHAVLQSDGNFIIYRGDWRKSQVGNTALWSTRKYEDGHIDPPGGKEYCLYMQTDGNLAIYRYDSKKGGPIYPAVWGLDKRHPDILGENQNLWAVLCDDGNFVIAPKPKTSETDLTNFLNQFWKNRKYASNVTDTIDEDSLILKSLEYDLTAPKITQIGPPQESLSAVATNNTTVSQDTTLTMSVAETKSTSWKVSTSLKIGAKTSFSCGIPNLAKGEVETSVELTQGFEWNETTTTNKTASVSLKVNVPPGRKIIGKCTWRNSKIVLPYKAIGEAKFHGFSGGAIPVHVEGVYEGECSHDVETMWSDITDSEALYWQGAISVTK